MIDEGGFLRAGDQNAEFDLSSLRLKPEIGGDDASVYVDTIKEALEAIPDYSKS
jgi:hypothetical protein